ncbi:MAG: helix-turn-helix transcriptional regulator [Ekhidna sp.]
MKTLRTKNGFSQEEFARMFSLSKSNINSYESGTFPKIETYIQMMDYYDLDPSKFINLDMEKHSLRRSDDSSKDDEKLSQTIDAWVDQGISVDNQFGFLENLSKDDIKKLYIKQFKAKEDLLKENLELNSKYIKLLEKE